MIPWVSASGTYLAALGMIYAVGKEAPNFLNEETLKRISTYSRTFPVSHTIELTIAKACITLDRLMKFREDHWSYVPAISRSLTLTLVMLLLASYPLRNMLYVEHHAKPTVLGYESESTNIFSLPLQYLVALIMIFLITNALADFLSFAKTRTLISRFHYLRPLIRFPVICLLEVFLAVIIAYFVSSGIEVIAATLFIIGARSNTFISRIYIIICSDIACQLYT